MSMFIAILLSIFLCPQVSFSEWATDSQASYEMVRDDISIDVADDGSYKMNEEVTYRAINEQGRSKLVLESIPYVPDLTEVKVLEAMSITEGVETKVDLSTLQRRKAKGPDGGLDSNMELVIPFTNVKVGSSIRYKVSYHHKKPDFQGIFTIRFFTGLKFPELGGKAVIKSVRPLHWSVADADRIFQTTESKEGPLYVLTIVQGKPSFKVPLDFSPSLIKSSVSGIDVSTGESWEKLSSEIRLKYEKILDVKSLPKEFKDIGVKASKIQDLNEKIDMVTSELASIMTYSGDWTAQDKFFYPQPLAAIAKKRTGDCKDFATATTAILRSIGITANVAMVRRSGGESIGYAKLMNPIDPQIVLPSLFNHAIVHVQNANQSIWVDPTNHISNSSFPFSDIAGSPALVLGAETKSLRYIPEIGKMDSQIVVAKTVRINADNTADTNGSLILTGEYAKHVSQTVLTKNLKEGQQLVVALYGSEAKENQFFLEGADLKRRISSKLEIQVKTLSEKITAESKEGKSYVVVPLSSRIGIYLKSGDKRVTDFYVGFPANEESKVKIIGYDFAEDSVGCVARTPWYSIERKLTKLPDGFEVSDKVEYKVGLVPMAEANSDRFGFELSHIQDCARAQAIEIVKIEGANLAQRLSKYTKAALKKLNDTSGADSIHAAMLAKHMAEQLLIAQPKDKDLRIHLYRSLTKVGYIRSDVDRTEYNVEAGKVIDALYSELPKDPEVLQMKTYFAIRKKDFEEVKKFFKLAYFASPKGVDIFKLGGYVAEKLGQFKVAEGSYNKALSFTQDPAEQGDIFDSLADIAKALKEYDKALEYYARAIEKLPKDAWLFSHYVGLLNWMSRWDEAIDVGEKMLKISDFGVGRGLLAEAYSGKAQANHEALIMKKGSQISELERNGLLDICMKALKYKNTESGCLRMMGMFALNTAMQERRLDQAQKAFDYLSRALKDEDVRNPSMIVALRDSAQRAIEAFKKESSRAPASR